MQLPPVTGKDLNLPSATPADPWLHHLGRVSYIRGHISLFAVGSVLLLTANLLLGSGGVWADSAIIAWGVLLVAHGIIAVIARLLQELLADEPDIRPASEMRWNAPSTWTMPPRLRENHAPSPAAGNTPGESSRVAGPASPSAATRTAPEPPAKPADTSADTERVSWQKATDAAWLTSRDSRTPSDASSGASRDASRDTGTGPDASQPSGKKDRDDKDDFTPLKLD